MSILRALEASLAAGKPVVDLDTIIEERIDDLKRIHRGIIYGRNPPSDFTLRKIEAVASRLLEATIAYRMAKQL